MHTDVPSVEEIKQLALHRESPSLSIYVPTSPISTETEISRLEFKSAVWEALSKAEQDGLSREASQSIRDSAQGLVSDQRFWSYLSNSLAVFITPGQIRTYRLPNKLGSHLEVSDRFHLKPLVRAVTFPHAGFVLGLSPNAVRLVEIFPDSSPADTRIPGLPRTIDEAVPGVSEERSQLNRGTASERHKVRLQQFSRVVDRALRPLASSGDTPVILAAAEPLASIFRSVSSLPNLAQGVIHGNHEAHSDAELAEAAREILDQGYREDLGKIRRHITDDYPRDHVALDLQQVARAATFGAIDVLLADIDAHEPGTLEESTGTITFGAEGTNTYGVGDEIVRRAMATGARVLAVRAEDMPTTTQVAALLRYPV
ncbi:baeRF11 domain-containing protein [Nesterenkonia natronophila]|uniref:Uncharacterized protein n=1 Tax=Nesterenkonia natronophila TaxID=2174932 RepID=A0A3A4F680_9MICC|nr:hypothetical protein [Nesterenkonia natronophila]RJN33186.1 hypothetical protein D3250_01450 [Nesterenkonia natronophila]